MEKVQREPRKPQLGEALIVFAAFVVILSVSIAVFKTEPHVPMFLGTVLAALMALRLGYSLPQVEKFMMNGILKTLQACVIIMIIGILVGVWIVAGVVPALMYYGLLILKPSIFLIAALIICSVTSLATGTSWGTMGTMGIALMGIAAGLGVPAPVAAGAIVSGAYFGDKMSPLSDTTNLAPAMAGTDVFTHVKFMILPTGITYIIAIVVFGILGFTYVSSGQTADTSAVEIIKNGILGSFNINPLLLIPPALVIVLIALKMPAIPGITLGILSAMIIGPLCQGANCGLGDILVAGYSGFVSDTGVAAVDKLLTKGGLMSMMYTVSMSMIAMMFGGIMEDTGQLQVVVDRLKKLVKGPKGLVVMTESTCLASNLLIPTQYTSLIVPGRMYAKTYEEMGLHPKCLSNCLESGGTMTSALVPWNTCAAYAMGALGVSCVQYAPFAILNWLLPFVVIALAFTGHSLADMDGVRLTRSAQAKKKAAAA